VMHSREPELVPNSQLSFPLKTKLSSSSGVEVS
jgi:hypothetical protein